MATTILFIGGSYCLGKSVGICIKDAIQRSNYESKTYTIEEAEQTLKVGEKGLVKHCPSEPVKIATTTIIYKQPGHYGIDCNHIMINGSMGCKSLKNTNNMMFADIEDLNIAPMTITNNHTKIPKEIKKMTALDPRTSTIVCKTYDLTSTSLYMNVIKHANGILYYDTLGYDKNKVSRQVYINDYNEMIELGFLGAVLFALIPCIAG